jgi:hypothetical protein
MAEKFDPEEIVALEHVENRAHHGIARTEEAAAQRKGIGCHAWNLKTPTVDRGERDALGDRGMPVLRRISCQEDHGGPQRRTGRVAP